MTDCAVAVLPRPESEVGLDLHACDHGVLWALIWNYSHLFITLGIFGMGVALKLVMMKTNTPEKFTSDMAWLTTASTYHMVPAICCFHVCCAVPLTRHACGDL